MTSSTRIALRTARSALLLIALLLTLSPTLLQAQPPASGAEQTLFVLTNRIRQEHALPPLAWDPALALAAKTHARRILQEAASLEHQYPGEADLLTRAAHAGAQFTIVSENLARGRATPASIMQLWMSTPVHRANLLNPELTAVGIAVLEVQGMLIAVQDLSRAAPTATLDTTEAAIMQLLRRQGLRSVVSSTQARSVCEQHATTADSARLIVQWEGDLSHLPDVLLQQLRQTSYQAAAVGVCTASRPSSGFTTGRVAVLLF